MGGNGARADRIHQHQVAGRQLDGHAALGDVGITGALADQEAVFVVVAIGTITVTHDIAGVGAHIGQ